MKNATPTTQLVQPIQQIALRIAEMLCEIFSRHAAGGPVRRLLALWLLCGFDDAHSKNPEKLKKKEAIILLRVFRSEFLGRLQSDPRVFRRWLCRLLELGEASQSLRSKSRVADRALYRQLGENIALLIELEDCPVDLYEFMTELTLDLFNEAPSILLHTVLARQLLPTVFESLEQEEIEQEETGHQTAA